jgi:2-amino-4-hydroxy-6-hydroxymethyldihydropteridine diphosphokinase
LVIIRNVVATEGFLGLGSNEATFEGSPKEQLELALARLEESAVEVSERSSFYLSEPVGGPAAQPWFVNAAARVRFDGEPLELLRICQAIETRQGRRRIVRNGPRTLDIDILLFGSLVLETTDLTLPHPRLAERRFALVPLVEIAANVLHPVLGWTMRELLSRCPDRSAVTPLLTAKSPVSP